MAKKPNTSKKKVQEPTRIITHSTPTMTESEKIQVKKEIEQKLYEIFKKYY